MRPARRGPRSQVDVGSPRLAGPSDVQTRPRVSDPPMNGLRTSPPRNRYYPPSSSTSRARPAHSRTAMFPPRIPPVPALPPLLLGSALPRPAAASTSTPSFIPPSNVVPGPSQYSSYNAATSTSSLASIALSPDNAAAISFADAVLKFAEATRAVNDLILSVNAAQAAPTMPHESARRLSHRIRFTELERIDSVSSRGGLVLAANEASRATVNVDTLPTELDESSLGTRAQTDMTQPKPARKKRWSLRSKPAMAAV